MTSYRTHTIRAQRRRNEAAAYLRGLLTLTVLLAVCAVAWFLVISFVTTAAGASENNGGQYAEPEGCTKIEFPDGQQTFVVPFTGDWTVKAGLLVETFFFEAGTEIAATNSKDISHVIGCPRPPVTVPPTTAPPTTEPPTTEPPVCHEDDPCWDCETMGNLVCGPVTTTTVVPEPPSTPDVPVTPAPPAVPVPTTPQFTG